MQPSVAPSGDSSKKVEEIEGLKKENEKLKYRIKHLTRALDE